MKLVVFDAPTKLSESYERRIQFLRENLRESPNLQLLPMEKVLSMDHVTEKAQDVEGLVFRKPGSKYTDSGSFLKWTDREEQDVMVTSTDPLHFVEYGSNHCVDILLVLMEIPLLHCQGLRFLSFLIKRL